MAKKKKKDEERYEESVAREQQQHEEGEITNTASTDTNEEAQDEETHKEEKSQPGKSLDDRRKEAQGIVNEKEVQDAAREAGDEPEPMREKERNIGAQVVKEARRKSQAPPSFRTKRKEPSKIASRKPARKAKPMAKKTSSARKTKAGVKAKSRARG